jgi:uncharacterized coiled-coil protein SlyX
MTRFYDRNLNALDEIEDLLEAYAEARLAPTGPVLARIRRATLAEAAVSSATLRRLTAGSAPSTRWALPRLQVPRRAFALGMATALTLGTGAAVVAAPPGSAFFNARVLLETVLLPGQSDARLATREQHLKDRLVEADAAASSGDFVALDAALAAYRAEVDNAVDEQGDSLDRLAHLEAMLAKHVAVLEALEVKVPAQASIEKAIVSSQKAVARLQEKAKERANQAGHPAEKPTRTPNPPPNHQQSRP